MASAREPKSVTGTALSASVVVIAIGVATSWVTDSLFAFVISCMIGVLLLLSCVAIDLARRYARAKNSSWLCRNCGYDLGGLPPYAVCPECGNTQPADPDTHPPAADPLTVIEQSLARSQMLSLGHVQQVVGSAALAMRLCVLRISRGQWTRLERRDGVIRPVSTDRAAAVIGDERSWRDSDHWIAAPAGDSS